MTDCKAAEHMPIEDGSRCDCGYFIHQEQGKEEPLDDGESVSPEVTDHGIKEAGDEIKALIAAERRRWETAAVKKALRDVRIRIAGHKGIGEGGYSQMNEALDWALKDVDAALTTEAASGQTDMEGRQ